MASDKLRSPEPGTASPPTDDTAGSASAGSDGATSVLEAQVTRRSLLKLAGGSALALGVVPILEACGGSATQAPATGAPATGAPATAAPATAAPATAAASSGGSGGKITIGMVSPLTGQLAGFAAGDQFVVQQIQASPAYKNGFTVGGKKYDVEIVVKDSQSDPNIAGQVAQQLITQNNVDLILTTSTPETTNPVAQAAETYKVPCCSTVVPWQAWYVPRQLDPTKPSMQPFKYTTMFFFGGESFGGCFIPMWDRIPTNKVVAGQFPNDADGNAFRAYWPGAIAEAGYTWVDGGAYPDGTTDFTSMISTFKTAKAEVFINAPLPPDFNTFWKQASQQGWKPKLATVAKVLLFPSDTDALGDLVINIATDCWWGPFMPYKSSLDGTTSQQLADAYTASSGKQWLQSLGSTYSLFEVAQLAMTAASDPHNHDDVASQLYKLKYTGMVGPLDFTTGPSLAPGAPKIPGIGIIRPAGVQWKKGSKFPYEMVVVDNSLNPDVSIGGDLEATNP